MTSSDVTRLLRKLGCELLRQGKGSHQVWRCGKCQASIPMHGGDIPKGMFRAIQRQLEPCLGKEWWKDG